MMNENTEMLREFYQRAQSRPHLKRTEFAVTLNKSGLNVATDGGCGAGSDIDYLASQGYQVHGFDINADAVAICQQRFSDRSLIDISQASFESFDYPRAGLVIANSSLFFASPVEFERSWQRLEASIETGGVFAGDFMGMNDSWADNYRSPTTPLTEAQVRALFSRFEIISFIERDETAKTSLGRLKHWHTYSVVAVKRR